MIPAPLVVSNETPHRRHQCTIASLALLVCSPRDGKGSFSIYVCEVSHTFPGTKRTQNSAPGHRGSSRLLCTLRRQGDALYPLGKKLTRLKLEKKQKQEIELKYRDEREKIEAKIKQLQKQSSNKCDLERSLRNDIHRKSQTERNLQYLISQSKCKKKVDVLLFCMPLTCLTPPHLCT